MSLLVSPRRGSESALRSPTPRAEVGQTGTDLAPAKRTDRLAPRWWVGIGLVVGLYAVYEVTRGMQSADAPDAERTGWALLHWEQRWHLAIEAPLNTGLQHLP